MYVIICIHLNDHNDITTTPCYFACYPGHDDSYRGIPYCGIYICFGCEKRDKHKEHQKRIKFRRSNLCFAER